MPRSISPNSLIDLVGTARAPVIVDVRRADVAGAEPARIPGALWRDHMAAAEWGPALDAGQGIVVYCAHGHNVSQLAAALLTAEGLDARVLEGGLDGYRAAGGPVVAREGPGIAAGLPRPSVWVTRARPKIDRIACPWLVRRFVDPYAVFHFVAPEWVRAVADELGAISFDVPEADYTHVGDKCSFDAFLESFGIDDTALQHLARIVRAADTARLEDEPQAAGLLAISLGLSAEEEDDPRQLEKGMLIYDALYAWCRHATAETHSWQPAGAA